MRAEDLKQARLRLGLNLDQMAMMLGYSGHTRRSTASKLERGVHKINAPQARLVEAYLSGYRPPDWPVTPEQQMLRIIRGTLAGTESKR